MSMRKAQFTYCGVCEACRAGYTNECHDPIYGPMAANTTSFMTDQELAEEAYYGDNLFSSRRPDLGFDRSLTSKINSKLKGGDSKAYSAPLAKCAHSHKPLKLKEGLVVHGGAASSPIKHDHDIYISFDKYSAFDGKQPWHEGYHPALHVLFPITDMNVPTNAAEFKKMVAWTKEQILAGKSVHGGCMGGHGRTGMWLAAVVKEILGIEDAIGYVRHHYCPKAVETTSQAEWLHKHFGIKVQKGYKTGSSSQFSMLPGLKEPGGSPERKKGMKDFVHVAKTFNSTYIAGDGNDPIEQEVKPMVKAGNIWGVEQV